MVQVTAYKYAILTISLCLYCSISGAEDGLKRPVVQRLSSARSRPPPFSLSSACPCENPKLCPPLQTPPRPELYAFQVNSTMAQFYDWSILTTVAIDDLVPSVLCKGHEENVRIVQRIDFTGDLTNETQRSEVVQERSAKDNFLDGVNIDYENPLAEEQTEAIAGLNYLCGNMTTEMHRAVPGSQVTFDVAWSPDCIDGRCYDYKAIADNTDFVFVMGYDLRSQVKSGPCDASANSPLNLVTQGVDDFLALGIPAGKMVMGVPWYGYGYECINDTAPTSAYCPIQSVPFRGVNCSDAAGTEIIFAEILTIEETSATTTRNFNESLASPWFNYVSDSVTHQMWFDDVRSLALKYQMAKDKGMLGIGMWTADYLPYYGGELGTKISNLMWDTCKDVFFSSFK